MTTSKNRIACTLLGNRILYGRAKNGQFIGETVDVTSDCLKAVIDLVVDLKVIEVNVDGLPTYEIEVRKINQKGDR